ncbi:calcium-binding protein [Ruegeria marina]|uniref:Ca2+-binding protein, RTX toxin-related n=1 Tax=Ruegeria marina TaxID=639004 RepID=A0A1G7FBL1_9RHOB|nr:calcium-binding protein [Ruegeria marina]SDE73272.1 Ca2+-binding protein, RTX toxin-related [Ruegeria marina]
MSFPAVPVGSEIVFGNTSFNRAEQTVIGFGEDGFNVFWLEGSYPNYTRLTQSFDLNGTPLSAPVEIGGGQFESLSSGNFVRLFQQGDSLYFQIFSRDGHLLVDETRVGNFDSSRSYEISSNSSGFAVVYQNRVLVSEPNEYPEYETVTIASLFSNGGDLQQELELQDVQTEYSYSGFVDIEYLDNQEIYSVFEIYQHSDGRSQEWRTEIFHHDANGILQGRSALQGWQHRDADLEVLSDGSIAVAYSQIFVRGTSSQGPRLAVQLFDQEFNSLQHRYFWPQTYEISGGLLAFEDNELITFYNGSMDFSGLWGGSFDTQLSTIGDSYVVHAGGFLEAAASSSSSTILTDERFVVSWFDSRSGDISFQIFARNGIPQGEVAIIGNPVVGNLLRADFSLVSDPDGISPETSQVFWTRNGTIIPGQVSPTYTVSLQDVGASISAIYTYIDGNGVQESVESAPTGLVTPPGSIIHGTPENDTLIGLSGPDSILGYEGHDFLNGLDGNDTIVGGSGNDTTYSGNGHDLAYGDDGNDEIWGGYGNDTIYGGVGNDYLGAADGNDLIDAGSGRDTVYGGTGNDSLLGGDGSDELWGYTGSNTIDAGAGNDQLGGNVDPDILYGGSGADTLFGSGGNDTLYANQENDEVWGGAGDDIVFAGYGDDTAYGGQGNDTLYGEDGHDLLAGDAGNDYISGAAGNDTLIGGEGDDSVFGGYDHDSISGDLGSDELYGNEGDDTLRGEDGNDSLFASTGNDLLYGGSGNDDLWGGEGDDTIFGNDGNDQLGGGSGNDILDGGSGNDILFSSSGICEMTGGLGADVFFFKFGMLIVNDFSASENDRIDMTEVANIPDFNSLFIGGHVTQEQNGTTIDDHSGNTVFLAGVNMADLTPEDFIF